MAGRWVGQQFEDGERGDGFAGAGFAHEGNGFAAMDVEADALHGVERAAGCFEIHTKILDFYDFFVHDSVHYFRKA